MLLDPKYAIEQGWIRGKDGEDINWTEYLSPNAIDFTLDAVSEMKTTPSGLFISKDKKQTRMLNCVPLLPHYSNIYNTILWTLEAGQSYDCMSDFYVNLPTGVGAELIVRSSLNRNNIVISSGFFDSGFFGHIGCVLSNRNQSESVHIERGVRVGQIKFIESDSSDLYKGGYSHKQGTHWQSPEQLPS